VKTKVSMGYKFSEMGYAVIDLASDEFESGEQTLKMYKKPVDFTRDPTKMKPYGWMRVEISTVKGAMPSC